MRGPEIIGVFFFLVIGLIVFFSLLFRHLQWRRETLHQERMKYLERGITPPDPDRGPTDRERIIHNSFWIAFWTGGVVPVVAVMAGAITASNMRYSAANEMEMMLFLWGGVVAICLAGVASAAAIMISTSRRAEDRQPPDTRGYQPPNA